MSTPLGLTTTVPLALLPVRLEIHFVRAGAATQLLVRIYPDEVYVDSHEPRLTQAEIDWGTHFWVQTFLAGNNQPRMRTAWRQLADQFGAPRAAYIADALQPSNHKSRPTTEDATSPVPECPVLQPRLRSQWPRPPQTDVLPDSWMAIFRVGGQRYTHAGPAISEPVALAPALDGTGGGFDADTLANDPKAGWLVDFVAAERIGMALRITYPAPYGTPLERLLVLGVKAGLSGTAAEDRLKNLFRAHRYVDGLAFVPQGTRTNNTGDALSGYTSHEDEYVAGPLADAAEAAFTAGDGSNRDVASRALGLDSSVLAAIPQSRGSEQRDAYHMNVALWKATWGYFLEQMAVAPESPSAAAIREGRLHFSNYVRGCGPLPTLRIGRQPYGLLPAISLNRWKGREGGIIDAPIVRALAGTQDPKREGLCDVWRRSLDDIPRIPGRADPASELVKVLAMQPSSVSFALRPAKPLAPLGTTAVGGPMGYASARDLAQTLGVTWFPRQLRAVFSPYQRLGHVGRAVVQGSTPEVLSEAERLTPNYVSSLIAAPWTDVRQEVNAPTPDVLLYTLLRHAALLEYTGAASRILSRRSLPVPGGGREPDIYDDTTPTPWTLLGTNVTGLTSTAVGGYLDAVKAQVLAACHNDQWRDAAAPGAIWRLNTYDLAASGIVPVDLADDLREFAAFARSVNHVASLPTAALSRLATETLDLASHRLDAWATSFATKRLEWLRQSTPRGVAIGGYGYVEDVVAVERTPAPPPQIPPGESAPELSEGLYGSAANQGYVQAPSLAHATTAAILRGGYLSRKASGDANVLAVNLSSQRVRTALWLLDGVRAGQPLSALLGYRFERGLHENHQGLVLDKYIPSFRALAPQPGDLPTTSQPQGALESVSARNVVDGLALLQRYRAGLRATVSPWTAATIPFGSSVPPFTVLLPAASGTNLEFRAIDAELHALDDAVDAISDLTIAEAVHQIAQGNPERAGAALESIAVGEAPPPDLQVIETPRTGIALTHRLIVLFSSLPMAPWTAATPRTLAEPILSAWASQLLGPAAADALCRVTYVEELTGAPLLDTNQQPYRFDVKLRELGFGPLDIVYLPEIAGDRQSPELEQRIAWWALQQGRRPAGVPESAGVRVAFGRQAGWTPATVSAAEVLEAARAVRRLITSSRALTPADLALPDAVIPDTADADVPPPNEPTTSPERPLRLALRADNAVATFRAMATALRDAIPADGTTIAPATARLRLLSIASFGMPGAVPVSPAGSGVGARAALHTQVVSVSAEVQGRIGRLDALDAMYNPVTATPVDTRKYHEARLREVFGQEFRVLPRFTTADPATLGSTFAASTSLQNSNPLEAVVWLQRAARVRDGASRLDTALMYAEALGTAGANLKVGQLPYKNGDRWVGLPPGAALGGRLSFVAHAPVSIDTGRPLAGLLVDEWVEVVPNAAETTGLAFHFNRPNARAPQAILLAVVPDDRTTWDLETLEDTVNETLELAKLRTVDLSVLREVGQFLPALYFAQPPGTQTVTSDLTQLL